MADNMVENEKEVDTYPTLSINDLQPNLKVSVDHFVDYMFQIVSSILKKDEAKAEIQAYFSIADLQSKQRIVLVSWIY